MGNRIRNVNKPLLPTWVTDAQLSFRRKEGLWWRWWGPVCGLSKNLSSVQRESIVYHEKQYCFYKVI